MPISKNAEGLWVVLCVNGCEKSPERAVDGTTMARDPQLYALTAVTGDPKGSMEIVYGAPAHMRCRAFHIVTCEVCGFTELYDAATMRISG